METIHNIIYNPWPWWVGGPLIGIFVIFLLISERKQLGISSSYQFICSKVFPLNLSYFKNQDQNKWQFFFIVGMVFGGLILNFIIPEYSIQISKETIKDLSHFGISVQKGFAPIELFNFSWFSIIWLFIGGFLLGFGARYANGCTAGHAIMGVSQFALSSIITTICFFIGGLIATFFLIPLIF